MAVLLSLASAFLLALGVTLQHRGVHATVIAGKRPGSCAGSSTRALLKNRVWLAGSAIDLCAYGLEVAALSRGRLTVVEPLLSLGLVFALPMSARLYGVHHRPTRWIAALCVAAAVTVFVLLVRPTKTSGPMPIHQWLIVVVTSVSAVSLSVVWAKRTRTDESRAVLLALAAGVTYGLTAAFTKAVVDRFDLGFQAVVSSWFLYALLGGSVLGLLFGQASFRTGSLGASLPTLTVSQRVVGTSLGVVLFGDRISLGAGHTAAMVLAVMAGVAGIAVLARPVVDLTRQVR